ncbi:MAG: tRNA (adenosine(37)-N6)-threonylcarbamoyltransferase complex ATPase subunit type 1 TsaE [Anaerolineae bacterium]|nr:tRNA (adenosine(37)-N6)-threonylcarbamoyltransferase complex ATPase subunit type 1 TsaE [Candidatus Roseilinea sp.]MDW8450873.1 tRNA (adenosine(37)-N6)-threonylcarbamoyltransferase complex ATPase subunit type 1 TsaE [Anaerolineae bacterium]
MAILEPLSIECTSHSEAQTQRLGARLGALLPRHAVIALHGPLGAGKTSFARGVGAGWGAEQPLRSPTFTLVQEHHRRRDDATLYHIDLYRVEDERDLASLGLEEILDDENGVCLIEWPERAPGLIPPEAIHVKLAMVSDTRRQLTFSTQDAQTWQVLLAFRKSAFGV